MFFKWIICFVLTAAAFALPAQKSVPELAISSDKSMVLLYRAPDTEWRRAYKITLNGSEATRLSNREVDTLFLSPGAYELRVKTAGINAGRYWLEVKPGETYYCRVQDRVAPRRIWHELEIIEVHPRTFVREMAKK